MQRSLASHQRWHFYLPRTLAGSGVQPAKLRRAAALLGSWELCLHESWRVSSFLRGCDHPGHELNSRPSPSTHCKHIYCAKHPLRAGQLCGEVLDVRG